MKNTKKHANELVTTIRDGLLGAEKALKEFINGKYWVTLGFDSFKDWYDVTLADITLASELRPGVIVALLEDGEDPEQVAQEVKGIGPTTVKSIEAQRKAGIPKDKVVARGGSRPGSGRRTSHFRINMGAERYQQVTEIAEAYDQPVEDCLLEAIDNYLAYWLPQVQQVA
jgi:hypothetical protein